MARKPDYTLHALNKRTEEKLRVGVAWKNDTGDSIQIKLYPFVVLQGGNDLVLSLFRNDGLREVKPEEGMPF